MIVGQRVDRYKLEKKLYDGEFTTIFRASHNVLGSRHALKIQNLEVPDEIPESLLQEGRIQSCISHRNVLGVSDALEFQRRIVLVMDYVRWESLADLLDRVGVLPLRGALSLFRGVVRGLRAMHIANVVHRDMKPENILLAKEEGRVVPKVCDFGLAKLLDPDGAPQPRGLSNSFRYLGTPEYMAPEQAQDPGRVDTRADMFSLGALLYELVTGTVAFESDKATEAMYKAAKSEYIDPSALNPEASPELVAIIVELLQPKAAKRLADCDTLLQRLDSVRG